MRGFATTIGLIGLLGSAATAQDLQSQQMDAISAFATVIVASRECGFELSAAAAGAMAEEGGLSPELLFREPYAGLLQAEEERLQAEFQAGQEASCDQAWAQYGAEGSVEPDVLRQ